ncbi:potassium cation channel protein (macronuclear) [Tetrahymena thermophila SB210]|uniref:Potassium cation channel protein n=1 Tax=Tetrahymena thermophila (strain SB210) TaxID=312017 RepID=Q233G7_TETTS|nr:potassium cation channel protein [Tetrahymena thermophila SB210]EAR91613.3 potassium cation channel protein [Tetrahymena thermophila SB210]|eukprot:XP_001011858.3 potassium cation channel protein [Tetrahymena thermophila SB210]
MNIITLILLSLLFLNVECIKQYQIYIYPYWPLTVCNSTNAQILLDSNTQMNSAQLSIISGYELQLVLQNIGNMKNDQFYQIQLTCVSPDSFYQTLANDASTTDRIVLGIGAQRVSQSVLSQNIANSMPIYLSSLKLIYQQDQNKSYWILFRPLSVEVIFSYLGLGIAVSLIVWFMEERAWSQPKIKHINNILEIVYDVFSSLFFTNLIYLQKASSRIVLWFFWFTTFVYIVIYQSELTLKVSESYTTKTLSSMDSAISQNYKIGVFDVFYNQMLSSYPDNTSNFVSYNTTNTLQTINQLFTDLQTSKIQGFLLETPLSNYYCSLYCSAEAVDEVILSFNYVSLFAKGTSNQVIVNYNSQLSKSQQSLPLSLIKGQIFDVTGLSPCQASAEQIKTSELAGVWIILGITFGITLFIWGIQKCLKVKLSKSTKYYYQFQNQKNQLFEDRLQKQIKQEVSEILENYKGNFFKQIQLFERSLMLQDVDEKSMQNIHTPGYPKEQHDEVTIDNQNEVYKRTIQKQSE